MNGRFAAVGVQAFKRYFVDRKPVVDEKASCRPEAEGRFDFRNCSPRMAGNTAGRVYL
jgi:hypothetical protein